MRGGWDTLSAKLGNTMYVSKFFTFTASVICQLAAGLAYCFSLYSDALKVPDCQPHDPQAAVSPRTPARFSLLSTCPDTLLSKARSWCVCSASNMFAFRRLSGAFTDSAQ